MNEEKEFLSESIEENDEQLNEEIIEEIPENETVETEIMEEFAEDEQVLYEQDLLDGEPEIAELTTEQLAEKVEILEQSNQQLRRKNKILSVCSAVFACLMIVFLGGMIGTMLGGKQAEAFNGLTVGKSYKANIDLADYSALTYKNTYAAPTEADIDDRIRQDLKGTNYIHTVDVKDALRKGDVTKLDFDGYIDGKIYDNACAKNHELELGSNKFIPGFEDGLVGKKVGESVTLHLTFPEDYSEESLQGKDVRFEVKILSATRTEYDELTDAIVKEVTKDKQKTVTAYKDSIYKELDETSKNDAKSNAKNELWTTIANQTTLKKYPQNVYDHFVSRLEKQFSSYYASYGVSDLEGFMKANGLELKQYVEGQIIYEYAIYTIAAEQGLSVEEADYTSMFAQYGVTTKDELAQKAGVEPWELESSILYEKVTNFLYENATAK